MRAPGASAVRRSNSGERPARELSPPPAATRRRRLSSASVLDVAVNYHEADFVQAVKDFTDARGADVIVDPVGGDVFDRSTRCVAFEGRIVPVGFTSGHIPLGGNQSPCREELQRPGSAPLAAKHTYARCGVRSYRRPAAAL